MLTNGIKYSYTRTLEVKCREILNMMMDRGNHGSSDEPKLSPTIIKKLIEEVEIATYPQFQFSSSKI